MLNTNNIIKNGINRHAILKEYNIGYTKFHRLYTLNSKYRIVTIYYRLSFKQIVKLIVNRGNMYQQYLNVDDICDIPTNVLSLVEKPVLKSKIVKSKFILLLLRFVKYFKK